MSGIERDRYGLDNGIDDDDERRDEYIEDEAPARAAKLMGSEDFAADKLTDLRGAAANSILRDAGTFFTRFHAAQTNESMAQAGYTLYRDLLPYIEAAALEQAREEVADEYDAAQADMPRNESEYRAELEAA